MDNNETIEEQQKKQKIKEKRIQLAKKIIEDQKKIMMIRQQYGENYITIPSEKERRR